MRLNNMLRKPPCSFRLTLVSAFSLSFASLRKNWSPLETQQFLYFSPEPQGQGSLRPTSIVLRGPVTTLLRKLTLGETRVLLPLFLVGIFVGLSV
jgi:hypothetical protein